jgi:hypothetical protein
MNIKLHRGYFIIISSTILICGIFVTLFVIKKTDGILRVSLINRAQTIAAGVHDDALKGLTGSTLDIGTDNYGDVKSSMINIRKANSDSHGVPRRKAFFLR